MRGDVGCQICESEKGATASYSKSSGKGIVLIYYSPLFFVSFWKEVQPQPPKARSQTKRRLGHRHRTGRCLCPREGDAVWNPGVLTTSQFPSLEIRSGDQPSPPSTHPHDQNWEQQLGGRLVGGGHLQSLSSRGALTCGWNTPAACKVLLPSTSHAERASWGSLAKCF